MAAPAEEGEFTIPRIEPVRMPRGYRLALAAVTTAVLLLPAIYLGLVVAVARLWWWWTNRAGLDAVRMAAEGVGDRAAIGVFVLYVLGVFVGVAVILFLVRPLFSRGPRNVPTVPVRRESESRLFSFLDAVCAAVGAVRPREVCVNVHPTAGVCFAGFFGGFLLGRRRLQLGLPLALVLTKGEFAGLLAHELAHVSQMTASRLNLIVSNINRWLFRVSMERDSWDQRLAEWSGADIRFLVAWPARGLIWAVRRILGVLLRASHALTCSLSRRTETAADRCQARLAGTRACAALLQRGRELSVATHCAHWIPCRSTGPEAAEDLPGLLAALVPVVPRRLLEEAEKSAHSARTMSFDTHPCDRDRLEAVAGEPAEGVYRDDGPAAALFADLSALCREASRSFYHVALGPEFASTTFVDTPTLIGNLVTRRSLEEAIGRFSQGLLAIDLPLPPVGESPPEMDDVSRVACLAALREEVLREAPRLAGVIDRRRSAAESLAKIASAEALNEAKVSLRPKDFGLPGLAPGHFRAAREDAEKIEREAAERLGAVRDLLGKRFGFCLALLRDPSIRARIPDGETRSSELGSLLAVATGVNEALAALDSVRRAAEIVAAFCRHFQKTEPSQPALGVAVRSAQRLTAVLASVREQSTAIPRSLDQPGTETTLGRILVPELSAEPQAADLVGIANVALLRHADLVFRLHGALCAIGEAVEEAVGLPPLPPPPENRES